MQLLTAASGAITFDVIAKNGQTVLTSQHYTSSAAAYNGAFSVQENGTTAASYEVLPAATGGTWYFNLRAANNEIIGTSQQYTTQESATAGRDAVIALLPSIDVL